MGLLLPIFLAAGLAAGLPIALHLLRSKPRVEVVFPTLQFLGFTAVRETKMHRLRRWLTLLLRCLVILLVAAAFSRPFWNVAGASHGRAVVVAVDNSFSMQAVGRWDSLRAWAVKQIAALQPGDQAGILLMNPAPRWLLPMTGHLDQVRETLTNLTPGFETTRYNAALRLAGDTLAHSGAHEKTVVWMGDGQELGWKGVDFSQPLPAGITLKTAPMPDAPKRQAAIVRAEWSSATSLRVRVKQYLPAQDTRTVAVSRDGKMIASQQVALGAGKDNEVELSLPGVDPAQVQSFEVALGPEDDLPADDHFYVVHDPDAQMRVLLTPFEGGADGFDFLAHAIDATRRLPTAPLKSAPVPNGDWPASAVVFVRGDQAFRPPLVDRLNRFLDAGGAAWIFSDGSADQQAWLREQQLTLKPVALGPDNGPLHLRNWDTSHPLLAPLADNLEVLLGIEFYRGYAIDGLDAAPLATWDDGSSAIAEVVHDRRHFFVAGFTLNRDDTNWPTQVSFVPFIYSAAVWLAHDQAVMSGWRVGDTITLAGQGAWSRLPPDSTAEANVSGSVRPDAPGIYRYREAGHDRLYAVNLAAEESDLSPWKNPADFLALTGHGATAPEPRTVSLNGSREEAESHQRIWWWLLALATVLLLAELRLANRTSI